MKSVFSSSSSSSKTNRLIKIKMTSQQQQQDKLKQLGNTLVQKEEYEQAAKFYDRALEVDSTSEAAAAIFSNRSLCLICTKQYTEALQDAEKAISLRPTWFRGYQRAAAACEKLTNKNEEGLKHLEKCFELDEATRSDVDLNRIKENFELNIIKQKAPSMTQDELKQIGNTFVKNQQYESAIAVYTLAIEKDAFCDAAVPILSNRSMAYFKIGKYKEAYEDGGFCCGIKPDWAKGFMRRGVAAEKLENWQIALESYDEYLKLDPQDEAGVRKNRKYVKKKFDEKIETEEQLRLYLEKKDAELKAITNAEQKMASVLSLFREAYISMNVAGVKLARKHGLPRLDTPHRPMRMSSPEKGIMPDGIAETKRHLKSNPDDETVQTLLSSALEGFIECQEVVAVFGQKKMTEQVSFLDFLLDIVEEEGYVHPGGRDPGILLIHICSRKSTRFRKDLIFVLFDRIEVSKKIFCKEKSPSNSDFSTTMLFHILFDFDSAASKVPSYDSTDVCTQDIYECIQTCLKAGVDFKTPGKTYSLALAVPYLRSLRVVELLLRYNADPNPPGVQQTPLACAFQVGRSDIARVLISHGAKLAEAPTPKDYLEICGNHPLVSKKFCPEAMNFLDLSQRTENKIHLRLNEETIQLMFECFTNQKLSFIIFIDSSADSRNIRCPPSNILTSVFHHGVSDLRLVEVMLRLKPSLATLPSQTISGHWVAPILMIFLIAAPSRKREPGFDEYWKSFVTLLINAGFDYRRDMVHQSRLTNGQMQNMKLGEGNAGLLSIGYDGILIEEMMNFIQEKTPKEEPPKKKIVPLPKRGRGGKR